MFEPSPEKNRLIRQNMPAICNFERAELEENSVSLGRHMTNILLASLPDNLLIRTLRVTI